jgi:hypothetical protein
MERECQDWCPEQTNIIKENAERISLYLQYFTNMGVGITWSVL